MDRHENDGVNGTLNGDTNGHEPKMLSLEIELADEDEEHQSLLRETAGEIPNGTDKKKLFLGRNAHGMRKRLGAFKDRIISQSAMSPGAGTTLIQGFLRSDLISHAVYHLRNALVLGVLAFFVLLVLEWEGQILRSEEMEEKDPVVSPHMWSYGGKFNLNHALDPFKKRIPLNPDEEADLEEEILDEGTERYGTWDIAVENILNEEAHYLHDPEKSPFASNLYYAEDSELDDRQRRFAKRMADVINTFGVWSNPDFYGAIGADNDFFEQYYYRDVPLDEFPNGYWQKDEEYIRRFLDEAQSLVEATKEGIMEEYNHPNPDDDEKNFFGVIIGDEHEFVNGAAHHSETKARLKGVAYLPNQAWNGLKRKLLHAMVTNDHFYVVVAGTEETYKANNFAKTQVMQFNYIMEPIFHKLGMTLISRNMGMSANPAISALGGADIIGETDILWHVQRIDSEEKEGEFDLLQKQAIMSGERVPIVLSPQWDELMQASKGKAWVGNIQPGVDFCQKTTMEFLPDAPACHNVHCDTKAWKERKCYVYDSICWELRSDWNPDSQEDDVGDQGADYPGYRRHQLEGRKMTLLLLHALNAAIEEWRKSLDDDRSPLPLPSDLWHVGGIYENIRESVMSLERTPGEVVGLPACEKLLRDIDARICHIPMHAFTEWTPRVIPQKTSLTSIINNLVSSEEYEELYDGPDIVPYSWALPDDEVDVHMIAIAANVTPGYDDDLFGGKYLDDDWSYYDDALFGDEGGNDPGRQMQQQRILRAGRDRNKDKGKKDQENKRVKTDATKTRPIMMKNDKVQADSDVRKGRKKNGRGPRGTNNNNGNGRVPQGPRGMNNNAKNKKEEQREKEEEEQRKQEEQKKNNRGNGNGRGKDRGKNNKNQNANNKPTQPAKTQTGETRIVYSGEKLEIAEGSGWTLVDAPIGFCDGSAQSRCNRSINNQCLLANHNHYKGSVVGGPKTNWLTMRVPSVKHGIILARLSFEANDGSANIPSDLLFDYAVNGVAKTISGSELKDFGKEIVSGMTIYPLVNARDAVVDGEDSGVNFDIAIRVRSFVDPNCVVKLSHIYFA